MKRLLAALMAMLLVLSSAAFAEISLEETELEDDELTVSPDGMVSNALPVDFSGGCVPLTSGYSEMAYEDPTIKVSITYKETKEYTKAYKGRTMGYWVVDIILGNASQLRTAAAESFYTETALPVETIAERVNAVVAFNADYFSRHNEGFAVRQGELIRDKLKGARDVLLIDEDGDFHVYHQPKKGELSTTVNGKKVTNAFYFGPILVEDGQVPDKLPSFTYLRPEKYYARLALCQVDTLHYKVILTTMEQDYVLGIRLNDFADLCQKEGAKIAYNLDGGYSTTLYFNHERLNAQKRVNFRDVPDILYFASAWSGEE